MTLTLTPYQDAVLQHFADLSAMPVDVYAQAWLTAVIAEKLEPRYLHDQTEAFVAVLKHEDTHAAAVAIVQDAPLTTPDVIAADGVRIS